MICEGNVIRLPVVALNNSSTQVLINVSQSGHQWNTNMRVVEMMRQDDNAIREPQLVLGDDFQTSVNASDAVM